MSEREAAKFRRQVHLALWIQLLTSFSIALSNALIAERLVKTTLIIAEILVVMYALNRLSQLSRCLSNGILREYGLKSKYWLMALQVLIVYV